MTILKVVPNNIISIEEYKKKYPYRSTNFVSLLQMMTLFLEGSLPESLDVTKLKEGIQLFTEISGRATTKELNEVAKEYIEYYTKLLKEKESK